MIIQLETPRIQQLLLDQMCHTELHLIKSHPFLDNATQKKPAGQDGRPRRRKPARLFYKNGHQNLPTKGPIEPLDSRSELASWTVLASCETRICFTVLYFSNRPAGKIACALRIMASKCSCKGCRRFKRLFAWDK